MINMESHDKEICEALHKQQVLEYLKGDCQDTDISSNDYAKKILAQCRRTTAPVRYIKNILSYSFIVLTLLFTVLSIFDISLSTLFSEFSTDNDMGMSNDLSKAKTEIFNGNYESARTILLDLMKESPNNGYILPTYAELCQLEGRYDEAAMVLIDYLNNVSGTQTIQKGNGLYMKLKELTGPFSPDVENAYQECLEECEKSIENFNYLDTLLKTQKYQTGLRFCDSMKQENVTDYYLYEYYFISYTQLGKYEECAAYFLSLADAWNEEGETFSYRLPLKGFIQDKLNELRPNVSEITQEKIDAAF